MDKFQIFVGGHFTTTAQILEVRNPFTGKIFAHTFLAGHNELEAAIDAAETAREKMKSLASHKREAILRSISSEITRKREQLALTLCLESGKPIRYALAEIDRAAQTFLVASEECK